MTPTFAPLPVALPLGCHGARVDVATVAALIAAMPAGEWPEAMRDAADSARRDDAAAPVGLRRADFLAGRLTAREAVRSLTGADAQIGRADDGSPRWPEGVEGSISHYGGVACAVARESAGGIGIDIAPLLEGDRLRAVVRRCLTPSELAAQPSDAAVSLAFAAKEALFKASHARVQRFVGFDEASVCTDASECQSVQPVTSWARRTDSGTWTAALGERLAAGLGVASVNGAYAWDRALVYAVIALPAPSIGS
ncbi:MAG: 4'-phosphopantetheinyl transferase superfamily protein [Actinobacteria bacterium]|nr:4'-phosphopantetheinyl transferase superfamily protein [Actinomycetota bacterium]